MSEPESNAWDEQTTGRERVRAVVESLEEPATVTAIADEAAVAWDTADSELDRMVAANTVEEFAVDGQTKYGPNLVRQYVDQILDLIREHERDELEDQLLAHQERLESLQDEYGARSATEFRDRLTEDDRTAAELRTVRTVASTWDALERERRLTKRALDFYNDVARLSASGDDRRPLPA